MFKSEETHLKKLWASLERREKQALRATNCLNFQEIFSMLRALLFSCLIHYYFNNVNSFNGEINKYLVLCYIKTYATILHIWRPSTTWPYCTTQEVKESAISGHITPLLNVIHPTAPQRLQLKTPILSYCKKHLGVDVSIHTHNFSRFV